MKPLDPTIVPQVVTQQPLPVLENMQRHVATAQTILQRAHAQDMEPTLSRVLALLGKAMCADRAYIFRIRDAVFLDNTHEWCAPGVPPMRAQLQKIPFVDGDPFWTMFRRNGSMIIPDLDRFPNDSPLRQLLDGQGIRALLATALWQDEQIVGFVGLDFTKGPRTFTDQDDIALRGLAASISLALRVHDTQRASQRLHDRLATAESRLAATIERTPKLLVETDSEGVITGFFQSTPMIFALNPQEVIGALPEQVLPQQVASIVRKAIAEVDRLGWSQNHTYPLELSGERKWFSLSAMPRKSHPHDRARGYMFVVTDVSETRRQDARIRQLVRVAELSTNLIMLTDQDRRITWANPAVHARTGFSAAMTLGKCPSEVLGLAHDDPDMIARLCARLDEGHSLNQELRAQTRRGVSYWLDLNIQPLRDPEGTVQGFMVVGVEITQHKMAEARALRDKVRTLDASKEGYAIFWPDGRVAFMNAELRRFLGLPPAQPEETLLWTDIAQPEFVARLINILPELMTQGFWTSEISGTRPDGTTRHSDLSLSVQDDGSIFLILRDITDRKIAEAERTHLHAQLQIAQSRQVMSHLAAGLAHDFANLVAVIDGSLDMLDPLRPDAGQAALTRIRAASAQAQTLVRDLMQFGKVAPRRAQIDMQDVACRALELIRPSLHVPVVTRLVPPSSATVLADATQVMQVVVNLALNADQALRASGAQTPQDRITLSISTPQAPVTPLPKVQVGKLVAGKRYVALTMADTGPGISEARRTEVLAPFATGRGAKRTVTGEEQPAGAGLGLSIVAHIVQSHGGALSLSTADGGGAEVTVYWPAETALPRNADVAATRDPASPDSKPLTGLNVLLVDDDDAVLQTLSALLSAAGAETASCVSPTDALAAVQEDPEGWDIVVSDHDMQPFNGRKLAHELVKIAPGLRIILLSGGTQLQFATDDAHDLPVAMLRKPIAGPELVAVLLREKLRDTGGPTNNQAQDACPNRRRSRPGS